MDRLSWAQMQQYWQKHSSAHGKFDVNRDPDGLQNVCHADAPLWLNRYYARFQSQVYHRIFKCIPHVSGGRALDVGCGAGRWSRYLDDRGYSTVGIDLQPDLIALNRRRYPAIDFYCTSIQEYESSAMFDLVSSVTVLQHIPFDEQVNVVDRLRSFLRTGGYAIVLENVHDQGMHVFSRTAARWEDLFTRSGFRSLTTRRYDYSPFLRLITLVARAVHGARLKTHAESVIADDEIQIGGDARRFRARPGLNRLQTFKWLGLRAALGFDYVLEPILVRCNTNLPTVHCGFLFEAV